MFDFTKCFFRTFLRIKFVIPSPSPSTLWPFCPLPPIRPMDFCGAWCLKLRLSPSSKRPQWCPWRLWQRRPPVTRPVEGSSHHKDRPPAITVWVVRSAWRIQPVCHCMCCIFAPKMNSYSLAYITHVLRLPSLPPRINLQGHVAGQHAASRQQPKTSHHAQGMDQLLSQGNDPVLGWNHWIMAAAYHQSSRAFYLHFVWPGTVWQRLGNQSLPPASILELAGNWG